MSDFERLSQAVTDLRNSIWEAMPKRPFIWLLDHPIIMAAWIAAWLIVLITTIVIEFL